MSNSATIKAYNSNVVVNGAGITCTGDEPKFALGADYSDEDAAMTNGYELAVYLTLLSDKELEQWLEENGIV